MPNTAAGRRAALTVWNSDGWIVLLTFTHPDMSPQRLALAMEDVTSGGNLYTALPFEIELPSDDQGLPKGSLRIANVTRLIWNALRVLDPGIPPQLTITQVLESAPDTIEETWPGLDVAVARGTSEVLEAEFGHEDRASEPFPAQRLIPPLAAWIAYAG